MPGMRPDQTIDHWKRMLGILHWDIQCDPISEMQVVDIWENGTPGHEFVGIAIYHELSVAIIHHTRPLQEDDIIHELLHIRYPDWSEDKVECWTDLLMGRSVQPNETNLSLLLPTG